MNRLKLFIRKLIVICCRISLQKFSVVRLSSENYVNRETHVVLQFFFETYNAAINGDMGWLSPEHSQWMCIARKWCRLVNMDESLLAKKIFLSYLNQGSTNRKIWCYRVKMFFIEIEHEHICQGHRLAVRATLNTINSQLHVYFESIWK